MFSIQCLESSTKSALSCNAKFLIEPLEKGHGITVGNALRRTLLSHIPGIAIVGVRISNVNHEFSTIDGIKEDVIEVLLNLKQLVFKGDINESSIVARLNYKGNGLITASDIELPSELTLVDSQQYIASCISYTNIEMEFLITKGYGYYLSNNNSVNNLDGFLTLDAVFLPVKKVNFFVETSQSVSSLKNGEENFSDQGGLEVLTWGRDRRERTRKEGQRGGGRDAAHNPGDFLYLEVWRG